MKEQNTQKSKPTLEQKKIASKKIAEWLKQANPEERKRVLEMLKNRKKELK